jgi:D-alanyl-D-alanine carboxypeptidase
MNDGEFIDVAATPTKNKSRFPALAQFLVLMAVLGGLLGGVVVPYIFKGEPGAPNHNVAAVTATAEDIPVIGDITPPPLRAHAVYVYDVVGNRALYNKNADKSLPLASITKLMTALVARELVSDDTKIRVPNGATTQASASGLRAGETLIARELRDYAMLASSNDAAYTIANGVGNIIAPDEGGRAFVEAMNITAEELELESFTFYNATGLDISPTEAGAYGSARDVTFLMSYILRNYPDILAPTTEAYDRIVATDGTYHEAENTNPDIYAIPGLLGSKTGYTDLAQGNLTIAFDAGYNRPIIITVLGSTYEDRFSDVLALTKSVREAFREAPEPL